MPPRINKSTTSIKESGHFIPEYIVVSDNHSEILLSTLDVTEAEKLAQTIRKAGGAVTVFCSLSA